MYRRISRDVKIAAMVMYDQEHFSVELICRCLGFSSRTFSRIRRLWEETGDVEKAKPTTRGRPRILNHDDVEYLLALVRAFPDFFLDELLDLCTTNRFISVNFSIICRTLLEAGQSRKRITLIAAERNEDLRSHHVLKAAECTPKQWVFMDETHKDERTLTRRYGRSRRGTRARVRGVFVRGRRVTGLGALSLDGMIAATAVEGSMTRDLFLDFFEHSVLPQCTPFPGPRSVICLDNARIHHGSRILELAEEHGVRIIFLPPYSPDLNPIEEAFSKIKAFIRRHRDVFATDDGILYDMIEVMGIITANDARGYFTHAGYF